VEGCSREIGPLGIVGIECAPRSFPGPLRGMGDRELLVEVGPGA
jgi:hypothetical protein